MKKKQIVRLNNDLIRALQCTGRKGDPVRFRYGVLKNAKIIEAEIESLSNASKPSPAYTEYEQKRVALAQLHANKDENDKPIVIWGMYDITFNGVIKPEFQEAFLKLQEEYKEAIAENKPLEDTFNKLLEEDCEFTPYKIKLEYFPEDIGTCLDTFMDLGLIEE